MKRLISVALLVSLFALSACSSGSVAPDGGIDATVDVSSDAPSVDAGNDTASPDASPPTVLDQAGKIALWLEASPTDLTLVDGGVATWRDKSKSQNDAIGSGALPVVESGAQAGHDAVHFATANAALKLADSSTLQFGTGQVYIVAVTKVKVLRMFWFQKILLDVDAGSIATGLELFDANGGTTDAGGPIFSPYGEVDNQAGNFVSWGTSELNDGNFHIVAFRRTSTTHIEVSVDDIAPRGQTVAPIDVSVPGQPVYLGAPPLTPGPGTPDLSIAEEIVLHDSSGTIADADVASLHTYLKQKYGL